jgi:DNA-binding NarL/FixJ family response regulator
MNKNDYLPQPIRAVIADDHQLVRQGLRAALQTPGLVTDTGILVVAEAGNGFEAIAEVKHHKPDLLFLDVCMPLVGGAEVIVDIRRWSPATKVLILTGSNAPGLICSLLDYGVEAMFSKGEDLQVLYTHLPSILQGGHYVAQEFIATMEDVKRVEQLTDRERQVLNMIVAGKTNKDISEILSISPKTVDKHRTSLMSKLQVHSLAELIAYALKQGMVPSQ